MVEGLLFRWITLQGCNVAPGDAQFTLAVESHLAYAAPTLSNETAVTAGCTAYGSIGELFYQLAGRCHAIEKIRKIGHRSINHYIKRVGWSVAV
jgi:hypothetical protein